MDSSAQWSQGIGVVKSLEEKKTIRAQKPPALNCPRCNSTHTKFCYYNNYSLSQPRYFCKTCRRYWTEGGSLRNVPVGGGSRRNKRSSPAAVAVTVAASIPKNNNHHHHMMMAPPVLPSFISQNPSKNIIQSQSQGGQDLNLAYPNVSHHFVDFPYTTTTTTTTTSTSTSTSAMEFLKSGFADSRGMIMDSNTMIMNSPGLTFSFDGFENGVGYHHHHHQTNNLQGRGGVIDHHQNTMSTTSTAAGTSANARILFPFEDLKPLSHPTSEVLEASRGSQANSSNGYWSRELGGGSW